MKCDVCGGDYFVMQTVESPDGVCNYCYGMIRREQSLLAVNRHQRRTYEATKAKQEAPFIELVRRMELELADAVADELPPITIRNIKIHINTFLKSANRPQKYNENLPDKPNS